MYEPPGQGLDNPTLNQSVIHWAGSRSHLAMTKKENGKLAKCKPEQ